MSLNHNMKSNGAQTVLSNNVLVAQIVCYQRGMTNAVRNEFRAWRAYIQEMQEGGMYSLFGMLRSMLLTSLTDPRFMLHQAIIENRANSVLHLVEYEPKWITPSAFTLARKRKFEDIVEILHQHTTEYRRVHGIEPRKILKVSHDKSQMGTQ
ncbi:hypothetical protein THRCLA_06119 [Thraustotheca clavata]|uniref:Uncharacterized protein n=1 Tax=Thraustotheca clavata TaxID=74557 RepID=A0A1V9ZQD8_9STRA|nr:hypothetical protein THRCLA_06119 [Thraustotheca clavata]